MKDMKIFNCLCLALLTVFFASCSPAISVKAGNSDSATISFSADFSAAANSAFTDFLSEAGQTTAPIQNSSEPLFSKTEIENFLLSCGAEDVSAETGKDGKTKGTGTIAGLSKSVPGTSKILSKTKNSLSLTLGPEQFRSLYESLNEESQGYFDLLMIPCLNDETMDVSEYENLLSFVYGQKLAKELVSQPLELNLQSPDSKKTVSSKITLGEVLTLTEPKTWTVTW